MAPSESASQAQAGSSPWIISRGADLGWFWGSALLSLAAGAVVLGWPALALPIFCAWLLFGDGPHFWSTWTRSLLDPLEKARRGPLLRRSFWIFLPGFLCWGLARITGIQAPWTAFLFFAAVWGYHHAVRQDYGLWALYARRAGLNKTDRDWDTAFLYASLWWIFIWFAVAHPLNAAQMRVPLPPQIPVAMLLLWVNGVAVYAASLAWRAVKGRPVLPGLFALLPCAGLYGVGFILVGLREPLIPGATNIEQAFAVLAITNGLQHGLQYLGLVSFAARNRYPDGGPSLGQRLSARPMWAWLIYVALSLPYVALNLTRAAAPGVHPASQTLIGLSLCLYWGFVLHHYWLDQYIWRPHADPQLRADLRLA